jgi:hypothetical protein
MMSYLKSLTYVKFFMLVMIYLMLLESLGCGCCLREQWGLGKMCLLVVFDAYKVVLSACGVAFV